MEDITVLCVKQASVKLLFRGHRQWHDVEWSASELGRPLQIPYDGYLVYKPENGKKLEKSARESDNLIVL